MVKKENELKRAPANWKEMARRAFVNQENLHKVEYVLSEFLKNNPEIRKYHYPENKEPGSINFEFKFKSSPGTTIGDVIENLKTTFVEKLSLFEVYKSLSLEIQKIEERWAEDRRGLGLPAEWDSEYSQFESEYFDKRRGHESYYKQEYSMDWVNSEIEESLSREMKIESGVANETQAMHNSYRTKQSLIHNIKISLKEIDSYLECLRSIKSIDAILEKDPNFVYYGGATAKGELTKYKRASSEKEDRTKVSVEKILDLGFNIDQIKEFFSLEYFQEISDESIRENWDRRTFSLKTLIIEMQRIIEIVREKETAEEDQIKLESGYEERKLEK